MADHSRFLCTVLILSVLVHTLTSTTLSITMQEGATLQTSTANLICVRSTTSDYDETTAEITVFRKRENETNFAKIVHSRFPQGPISATAIWDDTELGTRSSLNVEATPLPKGTLTATGLSCADEAYYYCTITATSNNQSSTIELSDERCAGYASRSSPLILAGLLVAFFRPTQN